MSTFAVLASEDFESKQARSRAVTAAIVRAQEMFDPYLSRASSAEDRADRILLIEEDLKKLAYVVSKEYGYDDYRHLYATTRRVLTEWEKPWEKDDDKDSDDKDDSDADDKDDDDDKKDKNPFGKKSVVENCPNCGLSAQYAHQGACPGCGEVLSYGSSPVHTPPEQEPVAPRPGGILPPQSVHAAAEPDTGDSYQSERADLPSNSDTGLGGPSPKIDKGSAGDVAGSSQKPIDVGSKKNQHELQNATDRADYNASDFDPKNPVRERVDIDKAMQPEHNVAPHTDTWHGDQGDSAGQAKPVTSAIAAKYQLVALG